MSNLADLIATFSHPRPAASAGEQAVVSALCEWLDQRGIGHARHSFRLFPYSNELIGSTLLGVIVLLGATIILHWPWPYLLLVGLLMALVIGNVVLGWPLVVWPIATQGENILVSFEPEHAERELIIATHYDSKTELFDHTVTGRFFGYLPHCIGLALAVLLLGMLDRLIFQAGSFGALITQGISVLILIPIILVVGSVGLNLIPGRWIRQSEGAIDNGAACIILLGLAEKLRHGHIQHPTTRITLAWFGGEEVSMQGSHAYLRSRRSPLPTTAINLELMGQNGPYVLWQSEGNVLTSAPTDPHLNEFMAQIVEQVTGRPAALIGGINSDGYAFIKAGIPTCVLGSYDTHLGGSGLHRPTDNRQRVVPERLAESVQILAAAIEAHASRHPSERL